MTFPGINPAFETFLEPTRIFLFGKRFPTLVYDPNPMIDGIDPVGGAKAAGEFEAFDVPQPVGDNPEKPAALPMPPGPVAQALRQAKDDGIFARIYGFSYEGHYYKLPRPMLFLVRGAAHARTPEEAGVAGDRAFNTRFVGVEAKDWQFGVDIRVWAVDKHDIAVCLDLEIGTYDRILLQSQPIGDDETEFRTPPANRSCIQFRSALNFRSGAVGPHQAR